MQDIWEFEDYQYPSYPTEKNKDLLKSILLVSLNGKSVVLGFFCGSGTTLIAAQELNRSWIGIDQSEQAIKITKRRLNTRVVRKLQFSNNFLIKNSSFEVVSRKTMLIIGKH